MHFHETFLQNYLESPVSITLKSSQTGAGNTPTFPDLSIIRVFTKFAFEQIRRKFPYWNTPPINLIPHGCVGTCWVWGRRMCDPASTSPSAPLFSSSLSTERSLGRSGHSRTCEPDLGSSSRTCLLMMVAIVIAVWPPAVRSGHSRCHFAWEGRGLSFWSSGGIHVLSS